MDGPYHSRLMWRALASGILLAVFIFHSGCSSYSPPEERVRLRIAVAPVIVDPGIPQLAAPLSRNLREKLAHSRGWQLVEADRAEAVLKVHVLGSNRQVTARDPDDTGRPLSYQEILRARVTWESEIPPPWGEDDEILVESDSLIFAQPALITSESASMVVLAEELSDAIMTRMNWPKGEISE